MEKNKGMNFDIVLEAVVQGIPYIGGPLATLYFSQKQEKRFRRLERFYQEIKDEMAKWQRCDVPDISVHNPQELAAIIECINDAVESEHLEFKRKLYKQYFTKTLLYPVNGNFDERKLFLDILGALTPLQVQLILFLSHQSAPIQGSSISVSGVESSVVAGSLAQLRNFGLIQGELNSIVFAPGGNQIHEMFSISKLGQRFNAFCLAS